MSFNHYYQTGRDSDVERLLEGFAFLTGRLRQKLYEDAINLLERAKSGAEKLYFYEG